MSGIADYKKDDRPKLFTWAPGEYINECPQCDEKFIGDKRAIICADCAYSYEEKESEPFEFEVEDRVVKVLGSYQADGTIKTRFRADDGSPRYVFRFDNPPGLLHIFNEKQLEKI